MTTSYSAGCEWKSEKVKWSESKKVLLFLWNFYFLNLSWYMGKKLQYGFKNLVKLVVKNIHFKITIGKTVFSFACKTSVLCGVGCYFWYLFCHLLSFFLNVPTPPSTHPRWQRTKRARLKCETKPCKHKTSVRQPGRESQLRLLFAVDLLRSWLWVKVKSEKSEVKHIGPFIFMKLLYLLGRFFT